LYRCRKRLQIDPEGIRELVKATSLVTRADATGVDGGELAIGMGVFAFREEPFDPRASRYDFHRKEGA
jgi:hypothetical protein